MTSTVPEQAYREYLDGLIEGDRVRCASLAKSLCDRGIGVEALYLNLFQRSLYEIGELWEQHRISVAVEHLATAITERLLTLSHPGIFSGPVRDRSILIACVQGEQHQLGGRMVADLCEVNGWRGDFLGADTPPDALMQAVASRKPDILGLSLSMSSSLPAMLRVLDAVTAAHPALPVLVGGQAFRHGVPEAVEAYPNVTAVRSASELATALAAHERE